MMTGILAAQAAKQLMNSYKYVYGAKGQYCTAEDIEQLIAQSPAYFADDTLANAARQKAGNNCADCSGYVGVCYGLSKVVSTWSLYDEATECIALTEENGLVKAGDDYIPMGAVLWKQGHVGIYVGNQTVVEARSELVDVQANILSARDFTHCLKLPNTEYTVYENDAGVEDSVAGSVVYIPWVGKIVNTPVVVPQYSPTATGRAIGFGMLYNTNLVYVVGESGDYYRIMSQDGYYGYVHSYYIGGVNDRAYENDYIQWTGIANSTTGTVNIRTGPATSYVQLEALPYVINGSTMDVLGEVLGNEDGKLWYQVQLLGNLVGFVRADLITKRIIVNYIPWIGEANSTTGTVNIRKEATVNSSLSSVHGPLSNGDVVTVTNEVTNNGEVWYAVSVDGLDAGFCRGDLIQPHVESYYVEWNGVVNAATGSANIRAGASTSAAKITASPYVNGTNVHVIGEELSSDGYVWYRLVVDEKYVGYCRCDLIAVTGDYPIWTAKANTTTGILNIRSGAGTGYAQIEECPSVPNGTILQVISQMCGSDGYVWYQIKVKGAYVGYVKSTLITPVDTVAYATWVGCANSVNGYVNVRSQPTTSSEVLEGYPKLNNGDQFDVIGQVVGTDGYVWYQVRIMGVHIGYIRSDLVSHAIITDNNVGYAGWAGIAQGPTANVNIRSAASASASIVLAVPNGTGVEVLNTENGTDGYIWYQVKCNNVYGYIRSDLVVHPGDTTGGNELLIIPCPPRGVVIKGTYARRYPSDSTDEAVYYNVGNYLKFDGYVKPQGDGCWYVITAENQQKYYIRQENLKIFPKAQHCGGEDCDTFSHHGEYLITPEYGSILECQECGYHVPFEKRVQMIQSVPEPVSLGKFLNWIYELEELLQEYGELYNLTIGNETIVSKITSLLRMRKYSGTKWNLILMNSFDEVLYKLLKENHTNLYNELYEYFEGWHMEVDPKTEKEKKVYHDVPEVDVFGDATSALDVEHFMATLEGYLFGLVPRAWSGWAGDTATLIRDVTKNVINQDSGNMKDVDVVKCAMHYLGKSTKNTGAHDDEYGSDSSFGYADICSDVDAIGVASVIDIAGGTNNHILSEAIRDYYNNYASNRYNYLVDDILRDDEVSGDMLKDLANWIEVRTTQSYAYQDSALSALYLLGDDCYTEETINMVCLVLAKYILSEL